MAVLERHLTMLASAVEDACRDHRGSRLTSMAEVVATAYLQAKAKQHDLSRALYLIAIDLDAGASIERATRRAEHAISNMLLTADDRPLPDVHLVAQILLATISGAVRAFYERGASPVTGSEIERELVAMPGPIS